MKRWITIGVGLCSMVVLLSGCTQEPPPKPPPKQGGAASSTLEVINLDEANFDTEIERGVVIVDFWATWCGPCKTQGPIIEQVAEEIGDKAKVAKLDVDVAPKIAKRFNIRGIPTVIVFKDGQSVKQFVGVTKADAILAAISSALGSGQ